MTIPEFVEKENTKQFRYQDAFFKQIISATGITPQLILESSVLDRYLGILRDYRSTITVNDALRYKYKYAPKKVSFDIYGTTEYWFLVLHANELFSACQMSLNKPTMYLYSRDIMEVVNEIINVEKKYIQKNSAQISDYITSE